MCTVEIPGSLGKMKEVTVPVGPETRVQDALDAAKASKRFRNLDVVVIRAVSNAMEPQLKLQCRFDHKTRRIGWESDYAILPGDRILVREDKSTPLDDVLGSLVGPMLGSRR
jgi:hypothetical protein